MQWSSHASPKVVEDAGKLIPVYPATKNLQSWALRRVILHALEVTDIAETLPDELRDRGGLIGRADALRAIHEPVDREVAGRGRERLRYDEAFLLPVVLAQRRNLAALEPAKPRAPRPGGLLAPDKHGSATRRVY